MKIGILTIHAPANFGANLQAYSSSRYFIDQGHETYIINYLRESTIVHKNKINPLQSKAHDKFVENKLPLTKAVYSKSDLIALIKEMNFDLIIVGSDAVWRILPENEQMFFMEWLFDDPDIHDVFVASMSAAHMGTGFKNLPLTLKENYSRGLRHFSYLTVRDRYTKKVLNNDLGIDNKKIKLNPDPVFLLDLFVRDEWENKENSVQSKKYYLMTLPENWLSTHSDRKKQWFISFKALVNNAGYKLVELPLPEGISGMNFDYTVPYPIDPIQWFGWIKNAKAFCGLRFHAIVSSIASGTPFYSIDSYGSSSLFPLVINKLGFYRFARLFDTKSKIRNLLHDSEFSSFRLPRNIELISPEVLFRKLEIVDIRKIISFRNTQISLFRQNMDEMINIVAEK